MDPDCLDTLSDKVFSDGMAEVIKYGCIQDAAFFDFLAARPSRPALMADMEHILYTCCDIKRRVVLADERDTGARMILNFGHTIGHAFELAGHYETWTHGQGVAAGMCVAARLGVELGITPPRIPGQIQSALAAVGLPTAIPCPWDTLVEAVGLDKKRTGDDIRLIVLKEMGQAVPHRMSKDQLLAMLRPMYGG